MRWRWRRGARKSITKPRTIPECVLSALAQNFFARYIYLFSINVCSCRTNSRAMRSTALASCLSAISVRSQWQIFVNWNIYVLNFTKRFTVEEFDDIGEIHGIGQNNVAIVLDKCEGHEQDEMWRSDRTSRPNCLPNGEHVIVHQFCRKEYFFKKIKYLKKKQDPSYRVWNPRGTSDSRSKSECSRRSGASGRRFQRPGSGWGIAYWQSGCPWRRLAENWMPSASLARRNTSTSTPHRRWWPAEEPPGRTCPACNPCPDGTTRTCPRGKCGDKIFFWKIAR